MIFSFFATRRPQAGCSSRYPNRRRRDTRRAHGHSERRRRRSWGGSSSAGPLFSRLKRSEQLTGGPMTRHDDPEWVEVASTGKDEEAMLIAGLLRSEGIPSQVEG